MMDLSEVAVICPYCGETITVLVEVLEEDQEYVEDCQVCCRPIVFRVAASPTGELQLTLYSENEA